MNIRIVGLQRVLDGKAGKRRGYGEGLTLKAMWKAIWKPTTVEAS